MKTSLRNPPHHFILHVGTNDLSSDKAPQKIAELIIDLACQLKNEIHDVSISTIILRTDDKNLNEKGIQVSVYLKELCKEKNIFLVDNAKKIKAQHLNKGKLHLTKHVSRVLIIIFINEISKVFHWQVDGGNLNADVEGCNFKDALTAKKYDECNISLKTIRNDNANKLIFGHLNINSFRNKFEILATQVKGKNWYFDDFGN